MPTGRSIAAVSAAKVNDITAAKAMPIVAGATYVFDLGYYDYGWWAKLDAAGCRHRHSLQDEHAAERCATRTRVPQDRQHPLRSDRSSAGPAGGEAARTRSQPGARGPGRASRPARSCASVTNDLDAPAHEIADLYKRRWAIELFFRWIKQTLKIQHFLGTCENAVRIQIAVALIAFLLLRLAQAAQKRSTARSPSPAWSAPT